MTRDLPSWLPFLSRSLWWVLRVLAVLTLGLLLRWHVHPVVAIVLPALLALVLYLSCGPGDLPRRKLVPHTALVVVGDLLTVAVLFCSTLLVLRGQSLLVLVVLVIVLLCAVSLRWGLPSSPGKEAGAGTEGGPGPAPRVQRSPFLILSISLLALMLTATALTDLDSRPLREAVFCSWTRTGQGAPGWWEGVPDAPIPHDLPDALPDPVPNMPTRDAWLVSPRGEPDQRGSDSSEVHLAGGSERVLTLATVRGVVALDTQDGSPLWHLDTGYLRDSDLPGHKDLYSPGRARHVGTTVLVEYGSSSSQDPRFVAAFDELTGERLWCGSDAQNLVTSVHVPDRFAAVDTRGRPALFDAADGSVVEVLSEDARDVWPLLDEERRPSANRRDKGDDRAGFEFTDDRLLLWNGSRLSAFDLGTGREVFALEDEVPGSAEGPDSTDEESSSNLREASVTGRKIDGVVAADGVTVVSFQSDHIGRPPSARAEREYAADGFLAAYDGDGRRLWSSSGDGVVEEGGPLYGASLDQCPKGGDVVFDGHFLAHGNNRKASTVHAVNMREGTVTWSHDIEVDRISCYSSSSAVVLGDSLLTPWTTVTTSGVETDPDSRVDALVSVPGGLVLTAEAGHERDLTTIYVPLPGT